MLEADDLVKQLSERFTPDDAFMFGPHSVLDLDHIQTTANFIDTLPFDGDFPTHFMAEDDVTSESSVADLSQFIPKMPAVPSMCHIISVGKLVESKSRIKQTGGGGSVEGAMLLMDQCLALRLPPANPFDNFLRAACSWLPSISAAGKSFLGAFSLVEDEIDLGVEVEPKAVAESRVGGVIVKHWW
ncbi:unnamed protein product [Camellia sinensis]